jgi:hypothetical protein
VLLATAEVLRHLIAIPFVLFGLAVARWPDRVAAFYAKVFRDLGSPGYAEAYASRAGVWFVRAFAALFVVAAGYWVVVGTG